MQVAQVAKVSGPHLNPHPEANTALSSRSAPKSFSPIIRRAQPIAPCTGQEFDKLNHRMGGLGLPVSCSSEESVSAADSTPESHIFMRDVGLPCRLDSLESLQSVPLQSYQLQPLPCVDVNMVPNQSPSHGCNWTTVGHPFSRICLRSSACCFIYFLTIDESIFCSMHRSNVQCIRIVVPCSCLPRRTSQNQPSY